MATQSVSYPICHKHVFSDYMKSGLWRSNPEQGPRIVERECNQIGVELLAALEHHVLEEVRGAVVGGGLVPAAGVDPHAHRGGLGVRGRLGGDAHAVGQGGDLRGAEEIASLRAEQVQAATTAAALSQRLF